MSNFLEWLGFHLAFFLVVNLPLMLLLGWYLGNPVELTIQVVTAAWLVIMVMLGAMRAWE